MARERSVCPLSNEMLHRGALGQVPVGIDIGKSIQSWKVLSKRDDELGAVWG
jgi:hypothetical protein